MALEVLPRPMTDLKDDLAALRIEREPETRSAGRVGPLGACCWRLLGGRRQRRRTATSRASGRVEVEVASVTERAAGTQAAVLNASGYVTARRRATVSSKITGKVVEVNVEEGMAVREGQILARLDDVMYRAALALAEAQAEASRRGISENEVRLAEAKLNYNRVSALLKEGIVTQADVDTRQGRRRFDRGAHRGARSADEGRRAADRSGADGSRQHHHPRAVQRHGDLQGRAARRDGVAGVRRRRIHPHRHLHDRRHALARDRSGRQRKLHQSREAGPGRHRHARRVSRLADSR